MSINIQSKTNYSYLFSGLSSSASNALSGDFLGQYASIKNGSYGKLMKAYYAKDSNETVKAIANKNGVTSEQSKALAKVETSADALKESADVLLAKGSSSVFQQKDITTTDENGVESTAKGYDTEAIYKAVNGFVTNYNATIKAVDDSENKTVTDRATYMANATISNTKMLNQLGITINSDSTLSIDKDTFMKADMGKAKTLFQGNGSYAYQVSAQASLINYAADHEANKASTYTTNGTLNSNFSSGNLFSSYF